VTTDMFWPLNGQVPSRQQFSTADIFTHHCVTI